jgi:phosphoserine phosphatase
MAKGNNALLIFDFDNTITNEHMHNHFRNKKKTIDYGLENGVGEACYMCVLLI